VEFGLGAGELNFNQADTFLFTAPIRGGAGGTVVQRGIGTTTLTGNNTYSGTTTISGGVLQVGNGGVTGTLGSGDVVNNSRLIFNRSDALAVGNVISGSGAFTKRGAGTTTLTAENSYAGTTTVEEGTLLLNGRHTGGTNYTVYSGAILGGVGSTTSQVTVGTNGTVRPGNGTAPGVLTVGGLMLNSGGTLNILLGGAVSSLLDVNGSVSLSGEVNFTTNAALTADLYPFLSYSNSFSGVFTSNNVPVGFDLFHDTNDKVLFLARQNAGGGLEVSPLYDEGNAIITGGSNTFGVFVYNTDSNNSATFGVADGTNTFGSIPNQTLGALQGTNAGPLTFTGTSVGTNTGSFTVNNTNGTSNNGSVQFLVYDHAKGSLGSNSVALGDAIVDYTGALTGSLSVSNAGGFRVPLATISVSTNPKLAVTDVTGVAVGSAEDIMVGLSGQGTGTFSNNVTVTYADSSSLNGASTNLGTTNFTVTATIYDHASGSIVGGTNLGFAAVHVGYTNQLASTNTLTISNAVGLRVNLGATTASTDNELINVDRVSGLSNGLSTNLTATLSAGQEVGIFTNDVLVTFFDDSSLNGASSNLGTGTITVTGYVYSGQGVWTNSGTGNWADFANWQVPGGTPGLDGVLSANDTATFGAEGSGTVTLNANASLLSLTFSNAAASYAVEGTNTLTLKKSGGTSASVNTLAGSHSVAAPVILDGDVELNGVEGTALNLSGKIGGSGGLKHEGAGTTTLAASNSFTGGTIINNGWVITGNAHAFGAGDVTINEPGTLAPGAGPSLKIGGDMTVNNGTYQWTLYTNANTLPGTDFTAPVQLTGKLQVAEDSPFAMFFTNVTSSDPFWTTVDARKTWRVMESVGSNSLVDGFSFKVAWATVPGNQTNGFDLADFFFTLDEENGHLDLNYLKTVRDLVATNVANGGTTISSGTNSYATVTYETNGLLLVDTLAELIITDPVTMSNNSTTTINGSFVAPGGVTVQVGSTIGGSGTIDAEIVNSGTFAPAVSTNSLRINNDLTFKSGSAFLWTLYNNTTNGVGVNFTAPVQLNAKMTVETNSRFTMLFTSNVNSADSFWKAEATNSWTVMTGESVDLQEGTMFKPDWAPGSQTNGFKLKNFYFTVTNNSLVLNFMPGLIVFPGEDEFDPGVNEYPWVQYQPGGELDIPVGVNLLIENAVVMNNKSTTIVNGQFTSTNGFTLANGSLLGGSGTLNGNLVSSGTVSAGNSPGTLTVNGNYTQTSAGAILFQAASLSSFDRIVVTGTASLAGALNAVGYGGYALAPGTSFQFLTATGGITGNFDTITLDNPTLRGRFLVSGANNSLGTLLIAPLTYSQMATTPNDASVAKALDGFISATSGDKSVVSLALDKLTSGQYAQAFAAIAPTLYQSLSTMAFNAANAQYNDLVQQMFGLRVAGTGFTMSGLGDNIAILEGQGDKGVLDSKKDILRPGEDNHWGMFVDGNGIFAQANSGNMLQNFNAQSGGLIAGLTYKWSPAVATGIYSGYQGTYAKYSGTYSGSTVINNAVRFGLLATYGDPSGRGFYGDALIGGSYNNYSVTRAITFPGMNRTANSTPGAGELDSMIAAGYNFRKGNWAFGPVSSLQYTYFGMNSFNETGAQSLDYQGLNWNTASMIYNLGANCAYNWKASRNLTVVPQVNLAWQHEFMQNPYNINGNLSGTPVVNTSSAPLRDTLYTGVGVTLEYKKRWNTAFFYNAAAGNSDLVSQNIFWSLGCKF
jgi:autotransporter-associated beta strand protein